VFGNRDPFLLFDFARFFKYNVCSMSVSKAAKKRIAKAPVDSFVRTVDLADLGSTSAIETTLSRACRRGDLERLEKGLYWKGARSRFGTTKPNWLTLALEVSRRRRAGGPSGATAAYFLSLSTQVPPAPEIAVVGPKPSGRVSRTNGIKYFMRSNLHREKLTPEEIAVLELAREGFRRVEISKSGLNERLSDLVATNHVRPGFLNAAAEYEPRTVRESLKGLSALSLSTA
jgi:hypothetical protein